MARQDSHAVIARCRELAQISDMEGGTFRPFLSPATKRCHALVTRWMQEAGLVVRTDGVGNLRGVLPGADPGKRTFLIGSHLDTVRNAGAFDGILGVILGIALAANVTRKLPFDLEVIGFSEEEGVRFSVPFIGSRAVVGTIDLTPFAAALEEFGVHRSAPCATKAFGYLEFHIEQGPVLDNAQESIAIVEGIVGQTRAHVTFTGAANHAGTTPMALRKDALTAAARWVATVEDIARATPGLVATVGKLAVQPNVINVIPGEVIASLDIRHEDDSIRQAAFERCRTAAGEASWSSPTTVHTIPMDCALTNKLAVLCPLGTRRMLSGAGHDAMILAPHIPSAMLFMRSLGGVSHHPSEAVLPQDVDLALSIGQGFLESL